MHFKLLHLLSVLIFLISSTSLSQQIITIKPGATLDLRLLTAIDASKMKAGDVIHLETVWPLSLGRHEVPAQSEAIGRVVSVRLPSEKKRDAELSFIVERIVAKDLVITLHAYPIRLQHRIARSDSTTPSVAIPETGSSVGVGGPPAGSGEGNVVIRPQAARQLAEPSLPIGAPEVVQLLEPMPNVKRVKEPPSTILKDRRNVFVSTGTTIVVKELPPGIPQRPLADSSQ